MPAVQLALLKNQIDKLIWLFNIPDDFSKALHNILESYSNRGILRPGRTTHPFRQINTYYSSPIIIREIEKGLKNKALAEPQAALELADELWKEDYSELRALAAYLLGLVPVDDPQMVLNRIKQWASPSLPSDAIFDLLDLGTVRLRREKPAVYLDCINDWLSSSSTNFKKIGLNALFYLVQDEQFLDLPKVYTLVSPMVKRVSIGVQGELRHLLVALINRSPSETAYILRQIVFLSPNPDTKRLLRKVLDDLPPDLRGKLRDLVNNPDLTT